MAVGDIIVGVDVGFSKVSILVGEINNFNQIEVIAKASKTARIYDFKGEINRDILLPALLDIVEEVEEKTLFDIKSAYITIPGKHTDIIQQTITRDTKDKLAGISSKDIVDCILKSGDINISGDKTVIDIVPNMYVLDTGEMLKDPIGRYSSTLTLYSQVILADTTYLILLQSIFKEINISIDGYAPIILVERNVLLDRNEFNDRVMIIDIADKETEVGVFIEDNIICTQTFDFGGDNITRDIETVLNISYEEALKLKNQYGLALKSYIENDTNILLNTVKDRSRKTIKSSLLAGIIEARVEDMFNQINKYITELNLKKEINNVILTGQGIKDIEKAEVVGKVALNLPVKLATSKLLNTISEEQIRTYSLVKYMALKPYAKTVSSSISIRKKSNFLKDITEKIKEFFYS